MMFLSRFTETIPVRRFTKSTENFPSCTVAVSRCLDFSGLDWITPILKDLKPDTDIEQSTQYNSKWWNWRWRRGRHAQQNVCEVLHIRLKKIIAISFELTRNPARAIYNNTIANVPFVQRNREIVASHVVKCYVDVFLPADTEQFVSHPTAWFSIQSDQLLFRVSKGRVEHKLRSSRCYLRLEL